MKKSEEQLLGFLDEYYIENPAMGSGNVDIAIRDLLTDLMHVALDNGVDIRVRFEDAAGGRVEYCHRCFLGCKERQG